MTNKEWADLIQKKREKLRKLIVECFQLTHGKQSTLCNVLLFDNGDAKLYVHIGDKKDAEFLEPANSVEIFRCTTWYSNDIRQTIKDEYLSNKTWMRKNHPYDSRTPDEILQDRIDNYLR